MFSKEDLKELEEFNFLKEFSDTIDNKYKGGIDVMLMLVFIFNGLLFLSGINLTYVLLYKLIGVFLMLPIIIYSLSSLRKRKEVSNDELKTIINKVPFIILFSNTIFITCFIIIIFCILYFLVIKIFELLTNKLFNYFKIPEEKDKETYRD